MDHITVITTGRRNHGYPYRGVCSCGWFSWGYVNEHTAQALVDAHLRDVAELVTS